MQVYRKDSKPQLTIEWEYVFRLSISIACK